MLGQQERIRRAPKEKKMKWLKAKMSNFFKRRNFNKIEYEGRIKELEVGNEKLLDDYNELVDDYNEREEQLKCFFDNIREIDAKYDKSKELTKNPDLFA
jgi:hypothetical protein